MPKDDAKSAQRGCVANDNGQGVDTDAVDAALTRIAEAIGRHIAREHIHAREAANDNDPHEL